MKKQERSFKCPFCNKVQTRMGVTSEADQKYDLETGEYETIDQISDTLYTFCLECGETLPKKFMELIN